MHRDRGMVWKGRSYGRVWKVMSMIRVEYLFR